MSGEYAVPDNKFSPAKLNDDSLKPHYPAQQNMESEEKRRKKEDSILSCLRQLGKFPIVGMLHSYQDYLCL